MFILYTENWQIQMINSINKMNGTMSVITIQIQKIELSKRLKMGGIYKKKNARVFQNYVHYINNKCLSQLHEMKS